MKSSMDGWGGGSGGVCVYVWGGGMKSSGWGQEMKIRSEYIT